MNRSQREELFRILATAQVPGNTLRVAFIILAIAKRDRLITLSQTQIADELHIDRATVNRAFQHLRKLGIIRVDKKVGVNRTWRILVDDL